MSRKAPWSLLRSLAAGLALAVTGWSSGVQAQEPPEFPPFEKVTEGFRKVEPKSTDGSSLFNLWVRDKDQQVYVEIPKYFIALTISSGDPYAGLQAGDFYVYWRQYDKRLALIAPNMEYRSTGEPESRSSVKRLFTDSVLLDVPIITMVPRGGPLVDADALMVGQAGKFFGGEVRNSNPGLVTVSKAKVFSKNTELAFEIVGEGGKLQSLHYSLSEVPENNGYRPRKADERVGYFTTDYTDLGIYNDEKVRTRFVNRWRLEKRDPALKVSPPVKPIEFYIEHTTPVRYRRWVKQGIEYWNKAFESVGISDAIVVYYQDAPTGKYMDLDPEDVQYNFIRWLNNNVGTAIGPSRVHPLTGEILDADIILTDGWIRHFNFQFNDLMPELASEGMSAETLSWLADHPNWDPRVRLGSYADRHQIMDKIARQSRLPFAGHALGQGVSNSISGASANTLLGRNPRPDQYCLAAYGKQLDMAMARLAFEMVAEGEGQPQAPAKEGEKKPEKPKEELLDGMPESFIGPLLADLVAHEVGHTLGLRHNFKASSVYTLAEINSEGLKGKKPLAGSVMDYIPVNFNYGGGAIQGDWTMIDIGPYDMWAIQYGYEPDDSKLPEILKRVSEPELVYGTDEDTSGPDPLARRYDYSKNPLDYAENQMRLVKLYRERLLEKFVKPGDSWAKARRGYELTLGEQTKALSMISNWVGGTFVNRDKKGDPGNRAPVQVVPVDIQRKALDFVIQQAFSDDSFGLKPEVIEKLSLDRWMDGGFRADGEAAWPIHDRILSIQASALTMLMNPTTLRRVYDNEVRTPADQDALTLPELLDKVTAKVWSELDAKPEGEASNRKPRISSLRRNLQREHVERLIDLTLPASTPTSASKVTCNLALMQIRELKRKIDAALENRQGMDTYSVAHLAEIQQRLTKALDADYIYNVPAAGGRQGGPIFIGSETDRLEPVVPKLP
jgi:hypothetical protein